MDVVRKLVSSGEVVRVDGAENAAGLPFRHVVVSLPTAR
jgi:hypothetical protein